MRPVPILLLLTVAPALTACGGWKPSGGLRVPPPDAALTAPCDRPEAHLRGQDWEVIAGRLGLSLIRCGQEKAALGAYVDQVRKVIE
jgi:hypothetical protein